MPSFNRVVLIGRLTRDPELRYTASGLATASFTIAVDRRFKDASGERKTDFFRCKAWRQTADFVSNYVPKGRLVAVEGRIEMNEIMGQDGQKKYFTDIVCDTVEILESNRDGSAEGGGGGGAMRSGGAPQSAGGGEDQYYPDEDAPVQPRGANRPAAAGNSGAAPAPRAAAPSGPAAGARGPAPRQPEPAYPADDFDDSDPFADE